MILAGNLHIFPFPMCQYVKGLSPVISAPRGRIGQFLEDTEGAVMLFVTFYAPSVRYYENNS